MFKQASPLGEHGGGIVMMNDREAGKRVFLPER